uniref:Ig-like domain-containing protein n=1 Tax=Sinocyclocheilus rhinocerous TaxID=307959 RepID=A0A673L482_9TELE
IMVSHGFYWTLWMLSCFGQYLGEDLQFSEPANGAVGGSVVLAPDNPPSTSIDTVQWGFGTTCKSLWIKASYLLNVKDSFSDSVSLFCLTHTHTHTHTHTERISNVRPTGPEESLIEGESSANISSEGTGSISSVQWMKDNSPLSPSNSIIFSSDNRSVSISPVQRSDSGEYQCISISITKSTVITTYHPEKTSISVTFSCSSVSRPQSQYSWYFIGLNVKNGSMYVTAPLSKTDSGEYTCMAFNNITGRSSSASGTLAVFGKSFNSVLCLTETSKCICSKQPIFNQPFTLTCTASGDVQHIQWMKNGTNLYSDNRINFTHNHSVLNFSDNGLYQCLASTAVNNMTSEAYDLQVFCE